MRHSTANGTRNEHRCPPGCESQAAVAGVPRRLAGKWRHAGIQLPNACTSPACRSVLEAEYRGWPQRQAYGTVTIRCASPGGVRVVILRLNIVTRFSDDMETIVQSGNKGLAIVNVPVNPNPKTREPRLFRAPWEHVRKSGFVITRSFVMCKPYVDFVTRGIVLLLGGFVPFRQYLYILPLTPLPGGHLQSLILNTVLFIATFVSFALGVIVDLVRINRSLMEDCL